MSLKIQTEIQVLHTPKVDTCVPLTQTEVLVDRYVDLYKKYESLKVKDLLKEMEEIKKELQFIANDNFEASTLATLSGPSGDVVFSPRAKVLKFNDPLSLIEKIYGEFGSEVAKSVVKIGTTELRKVLSPLEIEEYAITEEGSRSLKGVVLND